MPTDADVSEKGNDSVDKSELATSAADDDVSEPVHGLHSVHASLDPG